MAYSLSMAARDEHNRFPPLTAPLTDTQREQIRISALQHHHMKSPSYTDAMESRRQHQLGDFATQVQCRRRRQHTSSLPQTLRDALRPTSRAVVITETARPFRVVNVNKAWEELCGYTFVESKGKSLGSLLKGEETDQLAVTAMIHKLLQGEEAVAVLTNYTQAGRKFRNRLHVGPLFDEGAQHAHGMDASVPAAATPSYFVGILKEVA